MPNNTLAMKKKSNKTKLKTALKKKAKKAKPAKAAKTAETEEDAEEIVDEEDEDEDKDKKTKSKEKETTEEKSTEVLGVLKSTVDYLIESGAWVDFEGREDLEVTEEVYAKLAAELVLPRACIPL